MESSKKEILFESNGWRFIFKKSAMNSSEKV